MGNYYCYIIIGAGLNAWKWPYQVHKELRFGFVDLIKSGCKSFLATIFDHNLKI